MADSLQDLGARLVVIAQALASATDPNADSLRALMPAQVGDRLAETEAAITAAANGLVERAQGRLAEAEGAVQAAAQQADTVEQQTRARLDEQLERATTEADRLVRAAEAGLEQARATGGEALAAATETRDEAVRRAEQAKVDARTVFQDAVAQATLLADEARAAAAVALAEAEQAVTAAQARLAGAADAARTAVDDAMAAAAGLPGEATALGKDALERLGAALTWPSGILSLLAKALIWLKEECFSDTPELQVIWHEPAGAHAEEPAGLGLQWLQNGAMLRLVYRPPVPPAVGAGTLLIESKGADVMSFAAPNGKVAVTFRGHADQHVVVGEGVPAPAPGAGDAELVVAFDPDFKRSFGPLHAIVEKPTLTVKLSHVSAWTTDVQLDLPKYGATLRLSELLDQAGLPIPITVPSIDEHRSLALRVADGTFSIREGVPA